MKTKEELEKEFDDRFGYKMNKGTYPVDPDDIKQFINDNYVAKGEVITNSHNYPIEVKLGGDCYNSKYSIQDIIEGLKYGWLKLSDNRTDEDSERDIRSDYKLRY